jgi:hypothetical protein
MGKAKNEQQATLSQIAQKHGVTVYAARRAADNAGVRPTTFFGNVGVYDQAGIAAIGQELDRVEARRSVLAK